MQALGFREGEGFRNVDKIHAFNKSTLIIHAERDHIIPFSDGQALYDACQAVDKTFLEIPGANHNDKKGVKSTIDPWKIKKAQ